MRLHEQYCTAAFKTAAKDGHDFTFTTEDLDEFLSVVDQDVGTTEAFPLGSGIIQDIATMHLPPQMNSTSASTSEESGMVAAERTQYALAPAPTSTGTPASKGVCQQFMNFHIAANRTGSADSFTAANFAATDGPAAVDAVAAGGAVAALPVAPAAAQADIKTCWHGLQISRDSYTAAVDLPSADPGSGGSMDQQLLPTSAHSSFTTSNTDYPSRTVWDRTPSGVLPPGLTRSGQAQPPEAHTSCGYAVDSEGPFHHAVWSGAATDVTRDVRAGQAAAPQGPRHEQLPQLHSAAPGHHLYGHAPQTVAAPAAASAAASPSKLSASSLPSVASVLAAARRTSPTDNSPSAAAAMTAAHSWPTGGIEDIGWASIVPPGSMAPPAASSTPRTNTLTSGTAASHRPAGMHPSALSKHPSLPQGPYSHEDSHSSMHRAHSVPNAHPWNEQHTVLPGHWSDSRSRSSALLQYDELPLQLFLQPQPTQQQQQSARHHRHASVDGYVNDYRRGWESDAAAGNGHTPTAAAATAATATGLGSPADMQQGAGNNNHTGEFNTGNSNDWRTYTPASDAPAAGSSMMNSSARLNLSHSTVEKQRRDRLNSLIDELAGMVPSADPRYGDHAVGVRRPKHVVLADTINLLKALQAKLRADQAPAAAAAPAGGTASGPQGTAAGTSYLSSGAGHGVARMGSDVGNVTETSLHEMQASAPYDNPVQQAVLVDRLSQGSLLVKICSKERYNLLSDVVAALKCLPVTVVGASMTAEDDGAVNNMFEVRLDNPAVTPEDVQRVLCISLFPDQRPRGKRQRYEWEC